MKEKIILEIKKREMEKLEANNKKEDCIKTLKDIPMGTDVDELCQLVAKRERDGIKFYNKTWICDMRGFGGPTERDSKYELIDIATFNEEELNEILEIVKSSKYII
ncbi:MAG: hypothetical protein Q7K47_02460 [Fusobacterium sp. JB019]|nr:hypothetical protein [Fusobacterium sp. JB019]